MAGLFDNIMGGLTTAAKGGFLGPIPMAGAWAQSLLAPKPTSSGYTAPPASQVAGGPISYPYFDPGSSIGADNPQDRVVLGAASTRDANDPANLRTLNGGGGAAVPAATNSAMNDLLTTGTKGITAQYDQIRAALDAQAKHTAESQQGLEDQVNNLFGGSQGEILSQRDAATAQLDASRGQVDTQKASSLRDQEGNMRSLMDSYERRFGSNNSGAGMAQYALARMSTQERGKVLQNAAQLHNQINLKAADVARTVTDNLAKLETWKRDQLLNIKNDIQARLAEIEQRKMGANAEQQGALNSLAMQVKQQAIQNLSAFDQQYQQNQQAITAWGQQNAQGLQGLLQKLGAGVENLRAVDGNLALDLTGLRATPLQVGQAMADPTGGYAQTTLQRRNNDSIL